MSDETKSCTRFALLPLIIVALVLFLSQAFQTKLLLKDRELVRQTIADQAKPIEQGQKVESQLDALAAGILKLSKENNKSAQGIVDRLKQAGISIAPPEKASGTATAPAQP